MNVKTFASTLIGAAIGVVVGLLLCPELGLPYPPMWWIIGTWLVAVVGGTLISAATDGR